MKRFLTMALMGVLALGLGSTAYANLCSTDVVPAATLLFPFVEFDYEAGDDGDTTLIAITNVSSEAQIVHITIWTDFSVAILDFNLVLTGYDVSTMNIRDILGSGILPGPLNGQTIWEPLNDGPPPWDDGPVSDFNQLADYNFGLNNLPAPEETEAYLDCDPLIWDSSPNNYTFPIGTDFLNTLEGYLKSSQTVPRWYEDCDGVETTIVNQDLEETWFITRDSGPVWMYITADVVNNCNKELPDADLTYFVDDIEMANVLIGDVIWLNNVDGTSEADNAVHLEAADFPFSTPVIGTEDSTTFYYKHHLGIASDGREPLPTAWAFRYMWTASGVGTTVRAFKSGTEFERIEDLNGGIIDVPNPADFYASACMAYTYYAWDEDENVNSVDPGEEPPWSGEDELDPLPVPNLMPLETQEVDINQFFIVGDDEAAFGWMLVVWPRSNTDALVDGLLDAPTDQYQTWMGVQYAAFGTYTAGLSGAVMANWNCDDTEVLPALGLDKY